MGIHGSFPKRANNQRSRCCNPHAMARVRRAMYRWLRWPWFIRFFMRRPTDGRRFKASPGKTWTRDGWR